MDTHRWAAIFKNTLTLKCMQIISCIMIKVTIKSTSENRHTVRGAEGAEIETPKASRGGCLEGYPFPSRLGGLEERGKPKMGLMYFELERTHLTTTNSVCRPIRRIGINFVNCIFVLQTKIKQLTTTCGHRSCDVTLYSKRDKIGTGFGIWDNSVSPETA